MKNNIVFIAGSFMVNELEKLACPECAHGWREGTLLSPQDGGVICEDGPGIWQAGFLGPRGAWHGIGMRFTSRAAAVSLCESLEIARWMEQRFKKKS